MSTLELGYEQTRDLLELAVEERGKDFVYVNVTRKVGDAQYGSTCVYYTDDGTPSCIVGWVLNRLGVKFKFNCQANGSSITGLIELKIVKVDAKTAALLYWAQVNQDNKETWGDSLANAIDMAERLILPTQEEWKQVCTMSGEDISTRLENLIHYRSDADGEREEDPGKVYEFPAQVEEAPAALPAAAELVDA